MVLIAGDPTSDITTWVNFGVLGLVVVSLITGWLWTRPSVDRLVQEKERAVAERDRANEQRDAMAQVLQDKLLPVVTEFIITTQALLPILQRLIDHDQQSGGDSEPRRQRPSA